MKVLSIIIPVYNEAKTLLELLRRVRAAALPEGIEKEIILVDDASTDGTGEIADREEGIRVIRHIGNRGKGASVRDGLKQAKGDYVIIQDADLEYNPEEYAAVIKPLMEGTAEVVYGSRFLGGEAKKVMFFSQYWSNRILTLFSNLMTGLRLTDMETCYKAMTGKVARMVAEKVTSERFGIEPEITALVKHYRVKEVPISYFGRGRREGKKIKAADGLAAIWHIIKFNPSFTNWRRRSG